MPKLLAVLVRVQENLNTASSGGAGSRVVALCPRELGLNPGMDLAFSEMLSIYCCWAPGYLLRTCHKMEHTLPSFLYPIIENCI